MATYSQKVRALNKAIKAIEKEFAHKQLPPAPAKRRALLETDPNGLAHLEFCEDMTAIGDSTGTPWGGKLYEEI